MKSDFVSTDSDFVSVSVVVVFVDGLVSMTIIFGMLPAPVLTVTFLGGMIVYSCDSNNLDHGVSNFYARRLRRVLLWLLRRLACSLRVRICVGVTNNLRVDEPILRIDCLYGALFEPSAGA
jgi:hypothetical protein